MNASTISFRSVACTKRCRLLLALCFMAMFGAGHAQTPGSVTKFVTSQVDTTGYVLFAPQNSTVTYLISKHGTIVKSWNSSNKPGMAVYVEPNFDLYRAEDTIGMPCHYPGGLVKMYDVNSNIRWSYLINNANWQQTHDIYPMPNGHVLADVWQLMPYDSAIKAGRTVHINEKGLWSGMVVEIKPDYQKRTADTIWAWRFWDHLDPKGMNPFKLNVNFTGTPNSGYEDWIHMNAVTYNKELNQVMISSRNLNEIYIIPHTNSTALSAGKAGDFVYRWGNPQAYGMGSAADQKLFGQHSPYWIPAGYTNANEIMINNDGFGRPGDTTTINIIDPQMVHGRYPRNPGKPWGPGNPTWTYAAPMNLANQFEGNGQRLPNGNTLICDALQGIFYEISSKKPCQIVWEYTLNPGSGGAFRCTQYEKTYFTNNGVQQKKPRKKK